MKLSEAEVERLIPLLSATQNLDSVLVALLERILSDAPGDCTGGNCVQDGRTFVPVETQPNGMCSIDI